MFSAGGNGTPHPSLLQGADVDTEAEPIIAVSSPTPNPSLAPNPFLTPNPSLAPNPSLTLKHPVTPRPPPDVKVCHMFGVCLT